MLLKDRGNARELYEQIWCRLKMDNGFSKYLFWNMRVNQGCQSSLCTLCRRNSMKGYKKKDKLDGPKHMEELIIVPLYLNDVVLFLDTTKGIQPRHYATFTYKGEPTQVVQSFKYLGINVPSTNRWSTCYKYELQVSWNSYYMFENQCNQSNTWGWEAIKCYGDQSICL